MKEKKRGKLKMRNRKGAMENYRKDFCRYQNKGLSLLDDSSIQQNALEATCEVTCHHSSYSTVIWKKKRGLTSDLFSCSKSYKGGKELWISRWEWWQVE